MKNSLNLFIEFSINVKTSCDFNEDYLHFVEGKNFSKKEMNKYVSSSEWNM